MQDNPSKVNIRMERVKALADKLIEQIAQNADKTILQQITIQILAELEANPLIEQLPNNVAVIMPASHYAFDHTQPIMPIETIHQEPKTIKANPEPMKEVADQIALGPIKDLRAAIGINDKFQFIQELFAKDEKAFEQGVKTINAFKNVAEAQFWIKNNLRNNYQWEEESTCVQAFDQLVKRRFS
jgi:hypothetical protein